MSLHELIGTHFKKPEKSFRVIGIDLGTTNSTVAEFTWLPDGAGKLRCVEIDQETLSQGRATHILIPSMIALLGDKVFIGEGAKRLRAETSQYKLELYKNIFWECKNHMGLTRTYHKAPEGYRSAKEVAAKILDFLSVSANDEHDTPILRTVITVPASFQTAQRQDTLDSALFAGINVSGGDLLDEPMAAFLDYIYSNGTATLELSKKPKNLLVFDFGGGTCDIAVFRIGGNSDQGNYEVAPLAVSRYYRLGGGDIDKAIIHEVIIPELIKQNGLESNELGYEEKTRFIEPAFLSLAENLKVGLCKELMALRSFSTDQCKTKDVLKTQPGDYTCKLKDGREIKLQTPTLSSPQFQKLMEPFLDQELLFARETEYRMTTSIFGPITDCVSRSGLKTEEIDFCLMVGGSSLIPQVQDAVAQYIKNGKLLCFPDADATQSAVARGAACQALSLALTGKGVVKTISADSIRVQTAGGPITLLEKGTSLPFPSAEGWKEIETLIVPESRMDASLPIRIELINSDNHVLASCPGEIMPPVKRGQRLLFRYRVDENQILHFDLSLADGEKSSVVKQSLSNPFTNVVNPNKKREEIDHIEENIRTKRIAVDKIRDSMLHLTNLYSDLGQYEKALGLLNALLAAHGSNGFILNRMGIVCGLMNDFIRQEKYYLESSKVDHDESPLFNLALSKKNQGKLEDALVYINKAILIRKEAPYLVLHAMIVERLGKGDEKAALLEEAFRIFDPVTTLNDWELGWYLTAAQLIGDKTKKIEAEIEQRTRQVDTNVIPGSGVLPEVKL